MSRFPVIERNLLVPTRDGALPELVGAGDRESVQRNLLIGPRQRFTTARTAAADRTLDGGVTPHRGIRAFNIDRLIALQARALPPGA